MLEPISGIHARRALIGPYLDPVEDVWMRFQDGFVAELGTGAPPPGLLALKAEVVIPGLVDCHVHLTMDGGPDVETAMALLSPDSAYELARINSAAQVASGVTTVRDLGSFAHVVLDRRADLEAELSPVPSIVAAGAVSRAGGHGHFIATLAEGPQGYAAVTAELIERGARVIKVFATGGVVTSGSDPDAVQMSLEELKAVVRVAHDCQARVAAHAHGAAGIRNAVAAGVDSLEHFSYLEEMDQVALAGARTVLVSTLVATERFVASPERDRANPETLRKILAHVGDERVALRRVIAAGLPLAVGTDAGTTFNPHGGGMQEQAANLEAEGMTAAQVLCRLTRDGALLLGEPAGWLEVGRRADLLVLGADPLVDLTALHDLTSVIVRGHRVHVRKGGR